MLIKKGPHRRPEGRVKMSRPARFMLEFTRSTTMATVITERITKIPNVCGGKACVAGLRVRVMDIVIRHEDFGMNPDEIVAVYPELNLSDIHSALAYYFDNVDEIRNDIRRNDEVADQLRMSFPSKLKTKLLNGAD
jgi:uncharacterized protein (DUF433 family)